jgi:hypothetical protein
MPRNEPYPKPQPPRKGTGPSKRKPRNLYDDDLKQTPKFPKREMPKRIPNAIVQKPAKRPKGNGYDRDLREMPKPVKPKRNPKAIVPKSVKPEIGIMGSTPKKKDNSKQRMLDDMRKRGMLSKTRKKKM